MTDFRFRSAQVRLSKDADGNFLCPHCGIPLLIIGDWLWCPVAKANSDAVDRALAEVLNG